MSRYKVYPEYKDSGVEWIGKIPNHWKMLYSKWIFKERNIKATLDDDQLTASQKYGVISQKEFMRLENQKVTQVILNPEILKYVKEGDFVISMRSFQGGIEYSLYSGSISSAYVPLYSIQNISSSFFKYLFKSQPYIQALQSTSNLIRDGQALRYNNFIQINLPIFHIEEQQKIADFLDYETSKIDQLINKQKVLIELLKEKRQALISQAVTKGLNPKVKMKDSGIEWLGEVPEHWEIKPLKRIGYILSGYAFDSSLFKTEGIRVLKIANIQTLKLDWTDESFIDSKYYERLKNFALLDGDIVFALTRPIISTGIKAAIVHIKDEKILLNQRNACLRFFKGFYKEYFYYVLFSQYFLVQFENSIDATGQQPNISPIDIGNLKILCPPYAEQKAIYEYLRCKISDMDILMEKATKAVNLFQERRTALISAAVTGKIDVRDWQSPNAIDTMTNITPN